MREFDAAMAEFESTMSAYERATTEYHEVVGRAGNGGVQVGAD